MSVLREASQARAADLGIGDILGDLYRAGVQHAMWEWFRENRDRELFTVRKWIFSFTVRVKDLRGLFEILFGEDPGDAPLQQP